jgi:hypothetical protein
MEANVFKIMPFYGISPHLLLAGWPETEIMLQNIHESKPPAKYFPEHCAILISKTQYYTVNLAA